MWRHFSTRMKTELCIVARGEAEGNDVCEVFTWGLQWRYRGQYFYYCLFSYALFILLCDLHEFSRTKIFIYSSFPAFNVFPLPPPPNLSVQGISVMVCMKNFIAPHFYINQLVRAPATLRMFYSCGRLAHLLYFKLLGQHFFVFRRVFDGKLLVICLFLNVRENPASRCHLFEEFLMGSYLSSPFSWMWGKIRHRVVLRFLPLDFLLDKQFAYQLSTANLHNAYLANLMARLVFFAPRECNSSSNLGRSTKWNWSCPKTLQWMTLNKRQQLVYARTHPHWPKDGNYFKTILSETQFMSNVLSPVVMVRHASPITETIVQKEKKSHA